MCPESTEASDPFDVKAANSLPAEPTGPTATRLTISVGDRVRSLNYRVRYELRRAIRWSRGLVREIPAENLPELSPVQRRRVISLIARYHVRFEHRYQKDTAVRNYAYLDILDRARAEVIESKRAIEARCGIVPRAFAYPNGGEADYTPEVVELVRTAGFDCAVTTRFGLNTSRTSPWELRRGQPWEHHLPTFATKLAWYRMTLS